VTDTFAQIAIVGPGAAARVASIVSGVSEDALRAMPEHGHARATWARGAAMVARVTDTGDPGFDLYVERAQAGALKAALIAAGGAGRREGAWGAGAAREVLSPLSQ